MTLNLTGDLSIPTAHICDTETGAWFRFNDEEVEKIKSLKLNAEDDLEGRLRLGKLLV